MSDISPSLHLVRDLRTPDPLIPLARKREIRAERITADYREAVREANEIARRRFIGVPDYIREDYQRSRARRALNRYSSYGCYPLIYYTPHGDGLCAECAYGLIENGEASGIMCDAYYEGPPWYCDCGESIESAYGDPDAEEESDDA